MGGYKMNANSNLSRLFSFFEALHANNNRPWFAGHKSQYQEIRAEWIAGVNAITALISEEWPEVRHTEASQNTYRIYRDIRFSNDKTPFKTHISSSIGNPALRGQHTGIYLEAGFPTTDTGVWGGIWNPERDVLRKLRRAISDNAEEFLEIVNNPELLRLYGRQWGGRALKTAPKGYAKDHPMIEYLRLNDIGKFCPITPATFADPQWPEILAEHIRPAIPLVKFIDYSILEDTD